MSSPFFKFFGSTGEGLRWEIRRGGEVIDSSHPTKSEEPEKPADAYESNASAYNRGKGQAGRDAQKLAVELLQLSIERVRTRRKLKVESTEDENENPLERALRKGNKRRGI